MSRPVGVNYSSPPNPYIPHRLPDSQPGVYYRLDAVHAPGPVQMIFSSWQDAKNMAVALRVAEHWSFEVVRFWAAA